MTTEASTAAPDAAAPYFIDSGQAKSQIEKCESMLKEGAEAGADVAESLRYLNIARSFYRLGSFTKAFLFAVRARRIAKEKGLSG